jgi:hypothetical protein
MNRVDFEGEENPAHGSAAPPLPGPGRSRSITAAIGEIFQDAYFAPLGPETTPMKKLCTSPYIMIFASLNSLVRVIA